MPHSTAPSAARLTALVGLLLILGACTSTGGGSDRPSSNTPQGRNRAEAVRLADRAQKAHDAGKIQEAYGLYLQCIEADKSFYPCWHNLGDLLRDDGAYQEAKEAFEAAAALEPNDPRPDYNIGLLFKNRQYNHEALQYFRRSLDRDPQYLPALRGAIVATDVLRQPSEEALEWIQRAQFLDEDPEWHEFYQTRKLRFESQLSDRSD